MTFFKSGLYALGLLMLVSCNAEVRNSPQHRMQALQLTLHEPTSRRSSEQPEFIAACTESDHVVLDGQCFYRPASAEKTWEGARDHCLSTGGRLAEIRGLADNEAVLSLFDLTLDNGEKDAWIGISDLGEEGRFVWSNDIEAEYLNWAPGEPNNFDNQDCGTIREGGLWDDDFCYELKPFACFTPAIVDMTIQINSVTGGNTFALDVRSTTSIGEVLSQLEQGLGIAASSMTLLYGPNISKTPLLDANKTLADYQVTDASTVYVWHSPSIGWPSLPQFPVYNPR